MITRLFYLIFVFCLGAVHLTAAPPTLFLRNQFKEARTGDYLVTERNKNHTMLLVQEKNGDLITLEEITIPSLNLPENMTSWRSWLEAKAPGHTAWVRYQVDLSSGQTLSFYSYTQHRWIDMKEGGDDLLSTLLNLTFNPVPDLDRRRVGSRGRDAGSMDAAHFWQPRLVVDGETIPGVFFEVWRARWPKDGGELSDKVIEIYLPKADERYPSYFPYWLQVSGLVGKAKMRVIDAGRGLQSPMKLGPVPA